METGTQILIARMQSHPEEFIEGKVSRWAKIMSAAFEWLPEEDKQALREAIDQRRRDHFNETVLKTLAGEAEPEGETIRYKASERYSAGFSDPRAFANAVVKREGQRVMYDDHIDAHKNIVNGIREWTTKEK